MQTIRQALFTGWHLMRLIRLVFGIFFLVQAIQMHDFLVGIIAAFFLITALTNVGCVVQEAVQHRFRKIRALVQTNKI